MTDNFTVRSGKANIQKYAPLPISQNSFFSDLINAWDDLNHNLVTVPRRELAQKRNLTIHNVGDLLVIDKNGERFSIGILESVRFEDRGLPELVARTDFSIKDQNLTDVISVIFDEEDPETGEAIRNRATFNKQTRVSREALVDYVKTVGFNFFSDGLSTEAYWRISQNVGLYREQSSTYQSTDFISWMINGRFKVEPLWTKDGVSFRRRGSLNSNNFQISDVRVRVGRDEFFATSRVALKYDAETTPFIDLTSMQNLFLLQAPINVVLDRIIAEALPFEVEPKTVTGNFTRSKFIAVAA